MAYPVPIYIAPMQAPPAPQVQFSKIEQKDDCKPIIQALEDEIDRLRRELAAEKEREAQMANELRILEARLTQKQEVRSRTSVYETYKVKSFELAAKLAVMDGTDDGMYNGLPIEVEGEGLYRDLVARGRRPRPNVSLTGRPLSQSTTTETYKVQNVEMAEKLAKMSGSNDGKYNGLPIEVVGMGLYSNLLRDGRRPRS